MSCAFSFTRCWQRTNGCFLSLALGTERGTNIFLQTNFSPIDLKEEYLNAWLSSAAAKMPFRKLASAYRANASWPRFFPYSMLCNDPQALAMLVTHEKLKGIVTTLVLVFDHIE